MRIAKNIYLFISEWDCVYWQPWPEPDLQEAGWVLLLCGEVGGRSGLLQEGDRPGQQGGHPHHLPQQGAPLQRPVQRGSDLYWASSESGDIMDNLVKIKRDLIHLGSSSAWGFDYQGWLFVSTLQVVSDTSFINIQ